MRRTLLSTAVLSIVSLPLLAILSSPATAQDPPSTIVDVAVEAGTFSTLVAAVEAAGLVDTLRGEGPFTVFAPTDEAFAALPEGTVASLLRPENRDRLVRILTFHVVPGELGAAEALGRRTTVEGGELDIRIEDGRLRVADATVVVNDIRASNGLIHVIDAVLLPSEPEPAAPRDPRLAVAGILSLAIERGVPLYNDGQTAACVAVYEVAMRSILDRPAGCPEPALAALRDGLERATRRHDASDMAWDLRRGMDRALGALVLAMDLEQARAGGSAEGTRRIFDFDGPNPTTGWFHVNDDVMGGISTARFVDTGRGTARFEGALSLENNGGFATVRSRSRDLALGAYDGFRFRVRGDGRTYRVAGMASDSRMEVRTWQTEFATEAGEWTVVEVPFRDLVLNIMGRRLPDAGPIPAERIRALSFSIADKNEDPYALEIDWVEAYRAIPTM